MTSPQQGQQYMLPSKRHVLITRLQSGFRICCRYVAPDGGPIPKQRITQAEVSLTEGFLIRHAKRIR